MPQMANHARAFGPNLATKIRPWNDDALAALASPRAIAWRLAPRLRPDQVRAVDEVIAELGVYQMLADAAVSISGLPAAIRPTFRDRQRAAVRAATAALGRVGIAVWWRTVDDGRVELYVVPVRPTR